MPSSSVSCRNFRFNFLYFSENANNYFPHSSDFWIGANRIMNVPNAGPCHPWTWTTDQVLRFTEWGSGEPNNNGGDCTAPRVSDGFWYTAECSVSRPYVCALPKRILYCPSGWTFFEKSQFCYKTFFQAEWEEAEQRCVSEGAHLASIHSLDENDFVAGMAHVDMTVDWRDGAWIGLSTVKNNPTTWKWTDGTPTDYSHWADGEPQDDGNCATLYPDEINANGNYNLHWDDNDCGEKLRAFICKRGPLLA